MDTKTYKQLVHVALKNLKSLITFSNRLDSINERLRGMRKMDVKFDVTEDNLPIKIIR